MAEQEELRLTVNLADNASAGLQKLNEEIKQLGSGAGQQHIEKFKRETAEITTKVKGMSVEVGDAFKNLGMLRSGLALGGAGLALFGYEMTKQIGVVGEYAAKLRQLAQLGAKIGVDPGTIRNISDQLKIFGVSGEQAQASISKFATAMAQLQREPSMRAGILRDTAREGVGAMNALIDKLNQTTDVEDKLNLVRQASEAVRLNALKRGASEERAANEARLFGQKLGYDAELAYAGALAKRTEAEKKADQERFNNAKAYAGEMAKVYSKVEDIKNLLNDRMMGEGSTFSLGLKAANATLQGIIDAIKWLHAAPAPLTPEQQQQKDDSNKRRLQDENRRRELMGLPPRALEQNNKSTDENTDALKKLTSLIDGGNIGGLGMGGPGGGIINAAYHPGGGGPFGPRGGGRGFGGGGYANLGQSTSGYGGGAPYGSDVGAGTGAGAGSTPPSAGGAGAGSMPPRAAGRADGGAGGGAVVPSGGGGDPNLTGNAYLASQRARLKKELDDNPELKRRFAAIIQTENPGAGTAVAESAMNRAAMTGRSLASILQGGPKSFYGPARRGQIEPTMRNMSARTLAERYRQIDEGLAGSNLIKGATDQGSAGDPNYIKGGVGTNINRERFNDWGGFRGVEYSRRWREAQQLQVARSPQTVAEAPHDGGFRFGDDQIRNQYPRQAAPLPGYLDSGRARLQLDQAMVAEHRVTGDGKISVSVNAPKGTNVGAEGGGLFKKVEISRQTQMSEAPRGPKGGYATAEGLQ